MLYINKRKAGNGNSGIVFSISAKTRTVRSILVFFLLTICFAAKAQKVEQLYVNLYTDSLKKGTFNYINIDGKMSSGKFLPLDANDILFTASAGKFEGNSLWIDRNFSGEKVTIKAVYKKDNTLFKEFVIYIKTLPDPELKSMDDIMKAAPAKRNRKG